MARLFWREFPLVVVLALVCPTANAGAEEPTCPESDSVLVLAACEDSRLEHIKVTATRRETPVEQVPLSVTAIGGEALKDMGAATFTDYAHAVPGLTFSDLGFGGEKYTIRGVTTGVLAESRAATAVYLDETTLTITGFFNSSHAPDPLLVDIERIEVLRGPQGTLFGSGAMGGAIRILTREPDPSAFGGFAEATLSSTSHGGTNYELRAMLNTPLAEDEAAIRVVAYRRDRDGWIDNIHLGQEDVNNDETTGVRLAGSWIGHDRLTLRGKVVHQDRQGDGSMVDGGNPPWSQERWVEEPNRDEWTLANAEVGYEFDWGRLVSTTSWIDRVVDQHIDGTPFYTGVVFPFIDPDITTITSVSNDDLDEFTQEFRLHSSGDARLNWVTGLFFQDQDFRFSLDHPAPGFDAQTGDLATIFGTPDSLLFGRSDRSMQQTALFGDVIWTFNERWEGSVGGRLFRFDHHNVTTTLGLLSGAPTPEGIFEENRSDETGFTPKLGLSYFHGEDLRLYGSIASGYRPGGPNLTVSENWPGCPEELAQFGLDGVPRSYESDELLNYEVGIRSGWPDRKAYFSATAFYIDWKDMQTPVNLPCRAFWLANVGSATSRGLEVELAAFPTPNLELTLNGAYTDANLGEDIPGLGGRDGDELPGVPQTAYGSSLTWHFTASRGTAGSLRVDYQYVGESYNAVGFLRRKTPSRSLTNLRLGLHRNQWVVTLFIENLFDERAIVTLHDNPAGGRYVTTVRPFTIGLSISVGF